MTSSVLRQKAFDRYHGSFPAQRIPFKEKGKLWRIACVEWGASRSISRYTPVRESVMHMRINYDLYNGKLHMPDIKRLINPSGIKIEHDSKDTPENIQHYPLLNKNINLLIGEEKNRVFDWRCVITNPNALSEIEETKKEQVYAGLQQLIQSGAENEEEFNKKAERFAEYFTYEYQDMREIRGNELLNHYIREYNIPQLFNDGFKDALIVGEEIYQCDILGGEPIIKRINPMKIRVFQSGNSSNIEDADMIIMEDYWSPGQVTDAYYDQLQPKDFDYLLKGPNREPSYNDHPADEFIRAEMVDDTMVIGKDEFGMPFYSATPAELFGSIASDLAPFDTNGNVRVIQVYWKSKRKIKKVKSYDPETGSESFDFYPETYIINEDMGEEEEIYYINQAWEGTKIGEEIYVNIRPRPVQYNSMTNPSRCHFGIVGSIYNTNDNKPFTYLDMFKPLNYMYDIIHDRLNRLMANNRGKLIVLDFAKMPAKWSMDRWISVMEKANIFTVDSFKEGTIGSAKGKLAGGLNNAVSVIDAELSQSIQTYMGLLQHIEYLMTEGTGFSPQRLGQIANRETVGGVERATLQSSHITEAVFARHEDVKRRALTCFLETAKIAARGNIIKFSYITSDGSRMISTIDGDEFAECDYGIVVDSSNRTQELMQKLDALAQAALQNQTVSFSTVLKLYNTTSLIEKQRMIENDEKRLQQLQQQQQEMQMQMQQQQAQMEMQMKQAELEQENELNARDNETKIIVATIGHQAQQPVEEEEYSQEAKDKLAESKRQFNARLDLDKQRLAFDKSKAATDAKLKEKSINKKTTTTTK